MLSAAIPLYSVAIQNTGCNPGKTRFTLITTATAFDKAYRPVVSESPSSPNDRLGDVIEQLTIVLFRGPNDGLSRGVWHVLNGIGAEHLSRVVSANYPF